MTKGLIFWIKYPDTVGSEQRSPPHEPRPWVVVSSNFLNAKLATVQVVPLTQSPAQGVPQAARVPIAAGEIIRHPVPRPLDPGDQIALCHQVRVCSHERLDEMPVGKLSTQALTDIDAGLTFVFQL
ncbi:MAG: type II toxin-antitoxin system PemK/MazF family toxin [Sandaracinaceae bacterium]|nr:type II toxin-antitoxin system PemK/MazF family toxin [Sandaracinaceae bacterium]